jgi:hypothetical protein
MHGAQEQVMGMFCRKCRKSGIRVKKTEPCTTWSNAAEAAIRELKKGVGCQVVRLKAQKRPWDDCLEQEAYVCSLTAHEIHRLDGKVPETIVNGERADISTFATFKWYEWVLFRDTSVTYPDDTMILGPAIDIGPAMTRKVLKANGRVIYQSTICLLSPDEMTDEMSSPRQLKSYSVIRLRTRTSPRPRAGEPWNPVVRSVQRRQRGTATSNTRQ